MIVKTNNIGNIVDNYCILKTEDDKKPKKPWRYVFKPTYTAKDKFFKFQNSNSRDGLIFFFGAIIFPFLINIIVTSMSNLGPADGIAWSQQRLWLEFTSWIIALIVLLYLWIVNGNKFVRMGGLSFFWMILFIPVLTICFSLLIPYQKGIDKTDLAGYQILIQVIGEIIAIIFIFTTTTGLWHSFIKTYKDGWYFIYIVVFGVLILYVVPIFFNIFHFNAKSDNQNSLEQLMNKTWTIVLLGLFTLIVAPITEELSTRFGIFLLSGNWRLGLLGSVIFFSGMHVSSSGDWYNIIDYLAPAIVLPWVFLAARGNIAYSITVHSIFNIFAYSSMLMVHFVK